ncbi:MAG: beta-ketoacyl-ACP synthase III [Phycisphaerae bacterium]|jgi:3-oxoacyl-[acyl-carrier-protein] synthase-3|nr:beta-ketoacyl-ACP synthase III [Phycisphaerae bacterium]
MGNSPRAAIAGLGSAVPEKVLSNADLEQMLDTNDEWITQRTGIKERRIVSDGQSTVTLAVEAATEALNQAGMSADELDLIICATITPEMPLPTTACVIQSELGVKGIPAFDVAAACSGYIYALTVGSQFINTGTYKRVLVIGVDILSSITDYEDRGSCILFGDGAGAAVLTASDDDEKGVIHTVLHAEGSGWDYIHIPAGGTRVRGTAETIANRDHFIKMRGRDVYKFAVEKMQWLLGDCLEKCNLSPDDVDMVIPHQVNLRVISSAAKKFNFPMDKVFVNIDKYGNTSAGSVPLAMSEAWRQGCIGPGSTIILVAFGAGLTWAGAVIKL